MERDSADLTKLDGSNYSLWTFGVSIILEAKDLIEFIDGTKVEPDKEKKFSEWQKWKKASSQAKMIILSLVEKSLHSNLMNCTTAQQMWDKLRDLYGECTEDATQNAWEQFYTFRITDGESLAIQIEKFECICKKLADVNESPSEAAVVSKLLSSLPTKFSPFRMAWECTPKADRKKENLIKRLIREDKRLCEVEESTSSLAFQVQALNLKKNEEDDKSGKSATARFVNKKKIEELKKRTKCAYCKQKGHWVRECPEKQAEQNSKKAQANCSKVTDAYLGKVTASHSSTSGEEQNEWIADSGASKHMTYRRDYFSSLKPLRESYSVKIADDKLLPAIGVGTVIIQEKVNGQFIERELQDVFFVPNLKRNLFSIPAINDKKFSFHAYERKCEVRDSSGKLSSIGYRNDKLFKMRFKVKLPAECNVAQANPRKNMLWHERMGHINMRAVINTGRIMGVKDLSVGEEDLFCETCVMGKQTRKPHASVEHTSVFKPGEKIPSDACGPIIEEIRALEDNKKLVKRIHQVCLLSQYCVVVKKKKK